MPVPVPCDATFAVDQVSFLQFGETALNGAPGYLPPLPADRFMAGPAPFFAVAVKIDRCVAGFGGQGKVGAFGYVRGDLQPARHSLSFETVTK